MSISEKKNELVFPCTSCGLCCMTIGLINENQLNKIKFPYKAKENNWCEMLDENKKCKVYNNRPDVCNIEKNYEKYKNKKTKKEYYLDNAIICNELIEKFKLNDSFKINLNTLK
jgi:Fe-S-cluster containining protein